MLFALTNTAAETFKMDPMNFVENLSYMGVGMLGIFIVMGAIILSTVLLNKIFSGKKKDKED